MGFGKKTTVEVRVLFIAGEAVGEVGAAKNDCPCYNFCISVVFPFQSECQVLVG